MNGPSPRALVVDDDVSLRILCRVTLELEGFEVRDAGTVSEAEDALACERPDVVLLDVHLGGRPSDGLLDRLRSDGIPVALVTGAADALDYRDRVGAILTKPFEPGALIAAVRRLASVDT